MEIGMKMEEKSTVMGNKCQIFGSENGKWKETG